MDMDVAVSVLVLFGLVGASFVFRRRGPSPRVLATLAASVNRMRQLADRDTTYRAVDASAIAALGATDYYNAAAREIQQAGGRVLGDLAEVYPNGTLTQPARWFVDGTGTACGWFAILGGATGKAVRQVMFVTSETADGEYYTTGRGGAGSSTATSPKHHLAECRWADGLARQLEVHRAQIPPDKLPTLTRISTLDDATALFARSKKAKAAWRAAQPAGALLDLDLQQILQDRYPTFGAPLQKYIQEHPAGP